MVTTQVCHFERAAASREIYAFRLPFRLNWCEDPSIPLRSTRDDSIGGLKNV